MHILIDMAKDNLHPRVGNIFINPGTGPVDGSMEEYANQNIAQLVQDVGLEGVTYRRDAPKDYGEGRFAYQLNREERDVEVQMPGLPLDKVRYLEEGQNAWDFPRLYVDGSSWLWEFAVDMIRDAYENPDEE